MRVLAIDTSQPVGSVAVSGPGIPTSNVRLTRSSSHLVELGRAVDSLLADVGLGARDIDRIALVWGPGSFTGLRIGMAYAKGLHAGLGTEMVVVTSLELLALQSTGFGIHISPMIDARKDEVYTALYQPVASDLSSDDGSVTEAGGVRELVSPRATPPAEHVAQLEVCPTVFVGSGALRYRDRIEGRFGSNAVFPAEEDHLPSTVLLSQVATRLVPLEPGEVVALEPFYIRPSGAKLKPLRKIRTHE
ncbi:MAG: tRNA (adenosine(37)-N6)-threonylcarbamoyltransferase complex dimerization subunit type 1 TsaB [Candidatus Latescibacterota bacterium]|nr:MAG: tRNA (adenosine(37)-N6)-threonylcarbamoyltransferase complex dimerization subunit type 1 TsaB [Candidatus Latescibacterota bacterium]